MAEKEKTTTSKDRYEITEVPTETAPAFLDTDSNEAITQMELLRRISNDVEQLKKTLI